jgi:hypothetical protein
MSRGTLNTKNALNWLFTEDGVPKAISNMREFLFLSPLYIVFRTLIVIIMMSMRTISKSLLMVNFLGLREPGAGGLSPSVVEIEEHVIQINILVTNRFNLVEVRRNIADFT